jgi:hypothetical protein
MASRRVVAHSSLPVADCGSRAEAPITQMTEEGAADRALSGEPDVSQIWSALLEDLHDPTFREEAGRRPLAFPDLDGAEMAAPSAESLVPSS